MKRQTFYAVVIFFLLSALVAWVVYRAIPKDLLAAVDPGFDWNSESNGLQITLGDIDPQSGFAVTVKNVSNKTVSLRTRVNVKDADKHDISERGEGTFQIFMLTSSGERVSLHQYSNFSLGASTEKDVALAPNEEVTFHYHGLSGDSESTRIGTRAVLAGVRYYEMDPKVLGQMSDETKARQITYVSWSNLEHLPETQ